jgi:uncharacterized protein
MTQTAFAELQVIDADTHYTEPHDLWTSRAPAAMAERLPRVVDVDGHPTWAVGATMLGRAMASSVIDREGNRCRGSGFLAWGFDDTHPGAYDIPTRLGVMDEIGIHAQIVYPNVAGFGGQKFAELLDPESRQLCVEIYNNAMAEIQEASGGRLYPMALLPWWDVAASVAEAERIAAAGLRGVNLSSDPQVQSDLPDLGHPAWDPLWEACADLALPIHFHIGASPTTMSWYGTSPWPSHGDDQKLAIGSAMMYITNARVLANVIYSGMLERHPRLKVVSVESGIGWIPFVLEALDHQANETAAGSMDHLSMPPSAYFRRQIYACYWFERRDVAHTFEVLGSDNILFETDFPHPPCLYPDSLAYAAEGLAGVSPEVQRKVLQDNAAALYRIPIG